MFFFLEMGKQELHFFQSAQCQKRVIHSFFFLFYMFFKVLFTLPANAHGGKLEIIVVLQG